MVRVRSKTRRAAHAAGLFDELVVDNFAGGGGASIGIELALGRAVDVAVNHDRQAVALHQHNHPHTLHYCEDVWSVDPCEVARGRQVGLAWFSPDCKHFSRAKGAQPVEKKIRGLAWVVVRWAAKVRPRVIMLENVREFETWGPLAPMVNKDGVPQFWKDGTQKMVPCPRRKGRTFKRWVGCLRSLGYEVEWRVLNAADFGAPTHRRRLFLVARRDGRPIVWPEPTHGPGRDRPWRSAAECIDWHLPFPSIFLTKEEGKAIGVKRPLAPKTMARIAMGLERFVLKNPKPFLVRLAHGDGRWGRNSQPLSEPIPTLTGSKEFAVAQPFLAGVGGRAGQSPPTSADSPVGTITAKNDRVAVMPYVTAQYGEAPHQETRGQVVDEPLRTVTPRSGGGFSLVAPHVTQFFGGIVGKELAEPLPTVTSWDHNGIVAASLTQYNGRSIGQEVDLPAPTQLSERKTGVIAAHLVQYNQEKAGETRGKPLDDPLNTVTSANRFGLAAANICRIGQAGGNGAYVNDATEPLTTVVSKQEHCVAASFIARQNFGEKPCDAVDEPLRTVTSQGNHHTAVAAFLTKYFGTARAGQDCRDPLHTVTATDRFGVVTVNGVPHEIVDVGMRMLQPRELYRAQGFPEEYVIAPVIDGQALPKDAQVRMCGNSVCPPVAAALVRANFPEECRVEAPRRAGRRKAVPA